MTINLKDPVFLFVYFLDKTTPQLTQLDTFTND